MCGACRESDCECCDLLVWGGPCDCGCLALDNTVRTVLVLLNKPRLATPPRKPRTHCQRGHELIGENVYQESASSRRRCWTCRRASWRKYQHRKLRNQSAVA